MEFSELLDQIRGHFVTHLLEVIASEREASDVTIVHEPALRNGNGDIVRSGPLDTPMRVDLVKAKDGEVVDSVNVDTDEMLSFEPFEFTWPQKDLGVRIEPFQWNWLQAQTIAEPQPDDWHSLRDWYLKWFGEDDPAIDQLSGAVHYIADPHIDGTAIQLTIDLGTSPVAAFEELLDALANFGAKEVSIGQFSAEQ